MIIFFNGCLDNIWFSFFCDEREGGGWEAGGRISAVPLSHVSSMVPCNIIEVYSWLVKRRLLSNWYPDLLLDKKSQGSVHPVNFPPCSS